MEGAAKLDPSLRPRAHVFLSLMRYLAARGALPEVQGLRKRLPADVAGRVWPEDLWEADELVLEAAVMSAQVNFLETMKSFEKYGTAVNLTVGSNCGAYSVPRSFASSTHFADCLVSLFHTACQMCLA